MFAPENKFFSLKNRFYFFCVFIGVFLLLIGCGSSDNHSHQAGDYLNFRMTGQVLLPDSQDGLTSDLIKQNPIEVWIEQAPEHRATCDEDGRFLINFTASGSSFNLVARLSAITDECLYIARSVAIKPATESLTELEPIKLEPAVNRIRLFVKDLFGNAIAHAQCRILGIDSFADNKGEIITSPVPESFDNLSLSISASGFVPIYADLQFFSEKLGPILDFRLATLSESKNTPLLTFAPTKTHLDLNEVININLVIIDSDKLLQETKAIEWSSSDGILSISADNRSATWQAPSIEGLATITAKISCEQFLSSVSLGFSVGGSYQVNPKVTSFSPTSASSGQTLILKGSGFGTDTSCIQVTFASASAKIIACTDNEIKAIIPEEAESGAVNLKIGTELFYVGNFEIIDYQTSLEPICGPPETIVNIRGYGFGISQADSKVTLDGRDLPVIKWTNSLVQAKIIQSSRTGILSLIIRDRERQIDNFTVTKIASLNPLQITRISDGMPSIVSIYGTGFGEEQLESEVSFFDGEACFVDSWSDDEIQLEVPFGAKTGPIKLTISGVSLLTPTLQIVYHNKYEHDFAWSEPLADPRPLLVGVAVSAQQYIFATDLSNGWLWKFDENGNYIERIGTSGSMQAQFNRPWGVAVDSEGCYYVTDTPDSDNIALGRLQKFDSFGNLLCSLDIAGSNEGQLNMPRGIALSNDGHIYLADSANHRIQVFDKELVFLFEWGSFGNEAGEFNSPSALTVAPDGKVYVADTNNHRIQEFKSDGTFLRWYGLDQFGEVGWKLANSLSLGRNGSQAGAFSEPMGVCLGSEGFLYVADTNNSRIQQINLTNGTPMLIGEAGNNDGQLMGPVAIVSVGDELYIADSDNSRILVLKTTGEYSRKISPDTQAFNSLFTRISIDRYNMLIYALDYADGSIAVFDYYGNFQLRIGSEGSSFGQLYMPGGINTDPLGRLLVADSGNARIQIFSSDGAFLHSFGVYGTGSGQFRSPERVAVFSDGRIIVSDYFNDRVSVFSPDGSHLFSFGEYGSGNGQFKGPLGLAVASDDSIYIADSGNSRVQKFSQNGVFLGWIGADETDNAGWHGANSLNQPKSDIGPSRFKTPTELAIDNEDCLYVVDSQTGLLQKFGPNQTHENYAHQIVTLNSIKGFLSGAVDSDGNLYTVERDQQIHRYQPEYW